MATILLTTKIKTNIQACFDLARSIDFHMESTAKTGERAIAGTTSGLIGLDETVTWKAKHFGFTQQLTSKITAFKPPFHFRDEQVKGIFKYIKHDHFFKVEGDHVIMRDEFRFASPLGVLGKIADALLIKRYLKSFILERNALLKRRLENE